MVYYGYRKILASFVDQAQGVIKVGTLTKALFEDSGPDGGISARRAMVREVYTAYEPGTLKRLNNLMTLIDELWISRPDEAVLSLIHPPVVESNNNVIKRGCIESQELRGFYETHKMKFPVLSKL